MTKKKIGRVEDADWDIVSLGRRLKKAVNELVDSHNEFVEEENKTYYWCEKGHFFLRDNQPTIPEKKRDIKLDDLVETCLCDCHLGESEPRYKIACNSCGSGKQLYYQVKNFSRGYEQMNLIPYERINTETRSTEKRCPSCNSEGVEATKI